MPFNRLLKRDLGSKHSVVNGGSVSFLRLGRSRPDSAIAENLADIVAASPDASPTKTASTTTTSTLTTSPPAIQSQSSTASENRPSFVTKVALASTATIRSVPSFEGSESSPESKQSAFSNSVASTGSALSAMRTPTPTQSTARTSPTVRLRSEMTPLETPSRWNGHSPRVVEPSPSGPDSSMLSDAAGTEPDNNQWDSTIGKAGLGKTGRVINKLVSDNDALKREIQIEKLKSDEAKQSARLVEDKMERTISDYESRLLEANVTKTLLARKERQVETLSANLDIEKKKAEVAWEREKTWKAELEKVRQESAEQVDKATNYAHLMEGRYNAISGHWKEQGDAVRGAVSTMRGEIQTIVKEREAEDNKIRALRSVCDQQDSRLEALQREKEDIARKFEAYKQLQEDQLKEIKTKGRLRDEEQQKLLDDSREALHKLRWALNVKRNVKGAQ